MNEWGAQAAKLIEQMAQLVRSLRETFGTDLARANALSTVLIFTLAMVIVSAGALGDVPSLVQNLMPFAALGFAIYCVERVGTWDKLRQRLEARAVPATRPEALPSPPLTRSQRRASERAQRRQASQQRR